MPGQLVPSDPGPWWRLARALADEAESLRAQARRITASADATRWNSPAAAVFTARARESALQAARIAGGMDEAAERARRRAETLAAAAAIFTAAG